MIILEIAQWLRYNVTNEGNKTMGQKIKDDELKRFSEEHIAKFRKDKVKAQKLADKILEMLQDERGGMALLAVGLTIAPLMDGTLNIDLKQATEGMNYMKAAVLKDLEILGYE